MDELLCKYPFMSQARSYVKERNLGLSGEYLEAGTNRARMALINGEIKKFPPGGLADIVDKELAAYSICRMVVSALANRYYANRLAVAESKRASAYLASEDEHGVQEVADDLGISFERFKGKYSLSVADYVKFSPKSIDYKLIRQDVHAGKVSGLKHERFTRLLEEAIRKRIEASLPVSGPLPKTVLEYANSLKKELPVQQIEAMHISVENYPPCIKKIIQDLSEATNVPHNARWALAVYLTNAKMPSEQIIKLFASAPDFNFETTKYQVEHIKAKGYKMPSCATMDSWGACVARCRCFNPLKFDQKIHGRNISQEKLD